MGLSIKCNFTHYTYIKRIEKYCITISISICCQLYSNWMNPSKSSAHDYFIISYTFIGSVLFHLKFLKMNVFMIWFYFYFFFSYFCIDLMWVAEFLIHVQLSFDIIFDSFPNIKKNLLMLDCLTMIVPQIWKKNFYSSRKKKLYYYFH